MSVIPTTRTVEPETHLLSEADLEAIAADVWAAYLLSPADRPLRATGTALPGERHVLRATVTVTGAWVGQIAILLDHDTAIRTAEVMLDSPRVTREDVVDAVGELVNVVGGNVKSLMSSPSALSLPMVDSGTVAELPVPDSARVWAVDLVWAEHPLRIEVRAVEPPEQRQSLEQEAEGTS